MRSQADRACAPRDEGISRNLRVLGAVSLAQDVGSEMVYPLLPSFVTGVLGGLTSAATLFAGLWSGLAWHGNGRLPLTISGLVALSVALWLLATRGSEDVTEPDEQTLLPV
jgi:hypothetical protein